MSSKNLAGFYLFGVCAGFSESPWANGKGTSYVLGIQKLSLDKFGYETNHTFEVNVHQDDVAKVREAANTLKGKPVFIQVNPIALDGARGAWLKLTAPKGSELLPMGQSKAA